MTSRVQDRVLRRMWLEVAVIIGCGGEVSCLVELKVHSGWLVVAMILILKNRATSIFG